MKSIPSIEQIKDQAQKLLDDGILAHEVSKPKRKSSGLFAPSRFGRCFRFQIMKMYGMPSEVETELAGLKRMDQGTQTHKLNQKYLPKHMCEVRIETDDELGFADFDMNALITLECVFDIKSTESYQLKYWKKPINILIKDKLPNWLQVGWYGIMLERPYIGIIPVAYGEYYNMKNAHIIKTDVMRSMVTQELNTLHKHRSEGELPHGAPRAYNGKECNYCDYRESCPDRGK